MAQQRPQPAKRAFSQFSGKFFANLAPSATLRKGKAEEEGDRELDSQIEAHLCQLAMMENYAAHGMYVKFSDEEARALEDRSLQLALQESKEEDEARRTGRRRWPGSRASSVSSQTYSPTEVQRIIQALRSEEDPFISDLANPGNPYRQNNTSGLTHAESGAVPPPKKFSSFSKFKKKLMPGKARTLSQPAQPPVQDHPVQRELPRERRSEEGAAAPRSQHTYDSDGSMLAAALEESKRQADFDEALRDARALRMDLAHDQRRCETKLTTLIAQQCELEARCQRLTDKQKPLPRHLKQQAAEAEHNVGEAGERVSALREAVEELGHLEEYVRAMKPSKQDAIGLAEVIVRQLLGRLNFLGFGFHVPEAQQDDSNEIDRLVSKFRKLNPIRSTPPASPPLPPRKSMPTFKPEQPKLVDRTLTEAAQQASTSSEASPELEGRSGYLPRKHSSGNSSEGAAPTSEVVPPDAPSTPVKRSQLGVHTKEETSPILVTPLPWKPGEATPPAGKATLLERSLLGQAADLPPLNSKDTFKKAQNRLQTAGSAPRRDVRAESLSRQHSVSSLADSQGSRSTTSASQDLGPAKLPVAKRSSQVVHLYNEMRKLLPNVMQISYCDTQKPRRALLSKEKEKDSEEVRADARIHAKVVKEVGSSVSAARCKDIEEVQLLVNRCNSQLSVLKADKEAVFLHFSSFPKTKWKALQDAAEISAELTEFTTRMQNWEFNQGSYQEEVLRVEVFFDTLRSRISDMQAQVANAEKRWASFSVPWNTLAFRICRASSLHIATLSMSRALISVANLERSQTLKAEACIEDLAAAIRVAYKVHQFVGGFHNDAIELFEKVKRLAQYYVRSRDPTWLKDTTKFSH